MQKESVEFLKEMVNSFSPSGFEEEAVKVWKKRTEKYSDEVKVDVHGNSIAVLNKKGSPRVMLAGHIDEIGYMVKYIDKEGYLYFSTIGGIDAHLIPGQRVWIKTKKGKVLGIIGKKPIHVLEPEERTKVSKLENLWIDIGAKDEKQAKEVVDIGDPAVAVAGFEILRDDKAIARGFDDKCGAFVVSETMRLLSKSKINSSIYGVATVQEEIGIRGAKTSAFGIDPEIGIAIDVTFATDFPTMDKKIMGDISVGSGPVIARGPNMNTKLFEIMVKAAQKNKIPYQVQGQSGGTGTDANAIQLNKAGVVTGLIGIPNRYMHTSVELLSLDDLENAAKLLAATISRLSKSDNFIPF